MATVLARQWGNQTFARRRGALPSRSFRGAKKHKRSAAQAVELIGSDFQTGLAAIGVLLVMLAAVYLYQVNAIATKGYEIKKIESAIQDLQKENQTLQIKEVELKSMYNIEKSVNNLNLVGSPNVSYIETDGPVAMK